MKRYHMLLCAAVASVVITSSAISAFSQSEQSPATESQQEEPSAAMVPSQDTAKNNELSIYGEVQSVNTQTGSMTVQYYDYDNDEEKSIELTTDNDTKLENVKAIGEINKGDWADVTYTTVAGGKNMAKTVSVEKEEPAAEEEAPAAAEE